MQTVRDSNNNNMSGKQPLNLQGYKLKLERNERKIYTIGEAVESTHWVFPLSGQDNLNALRASFQTHLLPHHVSDEYGEVKPLAHISSQHLPSLQAKLWGVAPREQHTSMLKTSMTSRSLNQDGSQCCKVPEAFHQFLGKGGCYELRATQSEDIARLLGGEFRWLPTVAR